MHDITMKIEFFGGCRQGFIHTPNLFPPQHQVDKQNTLARDNTNLSTVGHFAILIKVNQSI